MTNLVVAETKHLSRNSWALLLVLVSDRTATRPEGTINEANAAWSRGTGRMDCGGPISTVASPAVDVIDAVREIVIDMVQGVVESVLVCCGTPPTKRANGPVPSARVRHAPQKGAEQLNWLEAVRDCTLPMPGLVHDAHHASCIGWKPQLIEKTWHVFLPEPEVLPARVLREHVVKAPDDNTVYALLPAAE